VPTRRQDDSNVLSGSADGALAINIKISSRNINKNKLTDDF
jgi:hypothetical protein